jgi:O-antigen ligase
MTMYGRPQDAKAILIVNNSRGAPPRMVEYTYYATFLYASMGPALGLSVGLLPTGMMAVLAAFCVMHAGSRARAVYAPIVFPLSCAISYIAVQLAVHGESFMAETVRPFVPWMLLLVIIQSLSLRQGFSHRFTLVVFVIGLASLPYLRFVGDGDISRAGLDQMSIGNSNDLAAWFGFCCVYFTVFSMDTKRPMLRAVSWSIVVVCLYVVGLTVSRGTLLAVAVATTVALRHLLKRGFIPVLLLLLLVGTIFELGLFEQSMAAFATRGTEETGRLLVWPLAIERFLSSPLAGVGGRNVETYVPFAHKPISPHNTFISIGLASGIVPLTFFLAYWVRAIRGALRSNAKRLPDAPFRIPLLIYIFLIELTTSGTFMFPYAVTTLSMAMAAGAPHQVRWIGRYVTTKYSGHPNKARYAFK